MKRWPVCRFAFARAIAKAHGAGSRAARNNRSADAPKFLLSRSPSPLHLAHAHVGIETREIVSDCQMAIDRLLM